MQDIEKASNALKDTIRRLQQRLDALLPPPLCNSLLALLEKKEGRSLGEILRGIVAAAQQEERKTCDTPGIMDLDGADSAEGIAVVYAGLLREYYKEVVQALDNGITLKMSEFVKNFVKKLQEQRKKAPGEFSQGLGDSMHTLKTLNVNFPSLEARQALSVLIGSSHKFQLGLILMLALNFALYLRSSPLLPKPWPKNMEIALSLIDAASWKASSLEAANPALVQSVLRTCFVDILSPLLETAINELKKICMVDVLVEYFITIGCMLDISGGTYIYSSIIRKGLSQVPLATSLRLLIALYMRTPLATQKAYYADLFVGILADKSFAVTLTVDMMLSTRWPVGVVCEAVGRMIVLGPTAKAAPSYFVMVVLQLFKCLYAKRSPIADPREDCKGVEVNVDSNGVNEEKTNVALYLLGQILLNHPDIGKKIIVRKFLIKLYDVGTIELSTLKREVVIFDTGSKFRNMDKKRIDVPALIKDIKLFVRFMHTMEKVPKELFECMHECVWSVLSLYSKSSVVSHRELRAALEELLRVYFCLEDSVGRFSAEDSLSFDRTVARQLVSYFLHTVTDYFAQQRAYIKYLLRGLKPRKEVDGDGSGNSATSAAAKQSPRLSGRINATAVYRCIKALADKRGAQKKVPPVINPLGKKRQEEQEEKTEKATAVPTSPTTILMSSPQTTQQDMGPSAGENRGKPKVEVCSPYSFSAELELSGQETVFVRTDVRSLLQSEHFSCALLHSATQENEAVAEFLLSLKGNARGSRVMEHVFVQILGIIWELKQGGDVPGLVLAEEEDVAEMLVDIARTGCEECPEQVATAVARNVKEFRGFTLKLLLRMATQLSFSVRVHEDGIFVSAMLRRGLGEDAELFRLIYPTISSDAVMDHKLVQRGCEKHGMPLLKTSDPVLVEIRKEVLKSPMQIRRAMCELVAAEKTGEPEVIGMIHDALANCAATSDAESELADAYFDFANLAPEKTVPILVRDLLQTPTSVDAFTPLQSVLMRTLRLVRRGWVGEDIQALLDWLLKQEKLEGIDHDAWVTCNRLTAQAGKLGTKIGAVLGTVGEKARRPDPELRIAGGCAKIVYTLGKRGDSGQITPRVGAIMQSITDALKKTVASAEQMTIYGRLAVLYSAKIQGELVDRTMHQPNGNGKLL